MTGGEAAAASGVGSTPLRADLRILATSDLHMQLTSFDHFRGRALDKPLGLAHLTAAIERLRAEAANALLFDNGDLLEGGPLAEHVAASLPWQAGGLHPAVAWLGALGCDAATLGNHDFGFGPGLLAAALRGAPYPVVLANARLPGRLRLPPWVVLHRRLRACDGSGHDLRVGVIGFIPPQTAAWEARAMPGLITEDILAAARRELPLLRAAGAEIVVALAHSGVAAAEPGRPGQENMAGDLAALPGIDAVIAGHVHLCLPDPAAPPIESPAGALAPVVMPGCRGSHLGVIDLTLARGDGGRWQVASHRARLHPAEAAGAAPPGILASLAPLERAAQRLQSRRVGRAGVALASHLTPLGHDAALALVAQAQRWHLRRRLAGTALAGLPVLASVAPFRSGGRGGPQHYTEVPAGRLTRRNLADLYTFPNLVAAVVLTGAQLADWLERSAVAYQRLDPAAPERPLLDPAVPGYQFEVVLGAGIGWRIDLGAAPRYDPAGQPLGGPGRVRGLCLNGLPLAPGARVVVATNSYRLAGVGLYGPALHAVPVVVDGPEAVRDVLHAYLRRRRSVAPAARLPFRLVAPAGSSATFDTAPGADLGPLPGVEDAGLTPAGFLRLRLRF